MSPGKGRRSSASCGTSRCGRSIIPNLRLSTPGLLRSISTFYVNYLIKKDVPNCRERSIHFLGKMVIFGHFASEFQEAGFPGTRVLRKSYKMHNHLLQFHQILLKTPSWGKLIFLSVTPSLVEQCLFFKDL